MVDVRLDETGDVGLCSFKTEEFGGISNSKACVRPVGTRVGVLLRKISTERDEAAAA